MTEGRVPVHLRARQAVPPPQEAEVSQPFSQPAQPMPSPNQPLQQPTQMPVAAQPAPAGPAQTYGGNQPSVRVPAPPRNTDRFDEYIGTFTSEGGRPPDPYALFTVQEGRMSSPRYLRLTSATMATDTTLQTNSGIPFAAVIQPLAEEQPGENPIPTVDMAGQGPFRCRGCMAYVNPFFQWIDGGRRVICNLCGQVQESGSVYFGDKTNRPECNFGTYEFDAPKEYSNKETPNPTFLICIDATVSSQSTGLYQQVLNSLRAILDYIPYPENTNIGIATFGAGISFYKLTESEEISEIIINNLEDPFAPEPISAVTFNLVQYRESLEKLLDKLADKQLTAQSSISVYSMVSTLKQMFVGGRAIIFSTLLGTLGAGKLKNRDDAKLYNTDKERTLFTLADESYLHLAKETTDAGLAIDLFACTHQYFDVASNGAIASMTGGNVHYHPRFNSETDGERLHFQFLRILTRTNGMQAIMRARVSNGLTVSEYFGNYTRKNPTDIEVGGVDADKSFTILVKHDERLKEENPIFMQFAMLYVNQQGQRKIRVFNACAQVTSNIMNIFRSADVNTIANVYAKRAMSQITTSPIRAVREQWHASLINLVYNYRLNSGSQSANQFVLPEMLKILPLLSNAAMKLPAVTIGRIQADLRMYSLFTIRALPVTNTCLMFNPRVYQLHDIVEQPHAPGMLSEQEVTQLPTLVPPTAEKIARDGAYLLDNGEIMVFLFCPGLDEQFIYSALGTDLETFKTAPSYEKIASSPGDEAQLIVAVVEELRRRNPGGYQPIKFAFDAAEPLMKVLLTEDNSQAEMSYPEYIGNLHKVVLNKLDVR